MEDSAVHPKEVLIVGAGVLGLSTALALLKRPPYAKSKVTIVDAAHTLPNPSAASIDTSRILRADYAAEAYTKLVSEAQALWEDRGNDAWGGEGRHHHAKLLLTEQPGVESHVNGYLKESLRNIRHLAETRPSSFDANAVTELHNEEQILKVSAFPGASGSYGYLNDKCGWVDAEACMTYAFDQIRKSGACVEIKGGCSVRGLLVEEVEGSSLTSTRCVGVELKDGTCLRADLTIVAAGAWTPSIIDLGGRAIATGQVLSYFNISDSEQQALKSCPIYFNVSRGLFMVPPHHNELKIGRHGFGYRNPCRTTLSRLRIIDGMYQREEKEVVVSMPKTHLPIPLEAEAACKEFLLEIFPRWKDRQFKRTRLCWYCDTPNGDFLVDYHPDISNLFIATGDSGHAFKLFPVIGEKIVDALEGHLDVELQELWKWTTEVPDFFDGTNDGTRGGKRGMVLDEEIYPSDLDQ